MLTQHRVCHVGMTGPDVLAYTHTYRQLGIRKRKQTRHFGSHTEANTKTFQHQHGLRADGVIGPRTFEKLQPHFDGYARWLLKRTPHYQYEPRQLVVGYALQALKVAPCPYRMVRPYPRSISEFDREGSDCSGTFELFYLLAHKADPQINDPSGFGFNGSGNTDSLWAAGHAVSTPRPADAVFYYSDHGHVGLYLGSGRVFSHGAPGHPHVISTAAATGYRSYL